MNENLSARLGDAVRLPVRPKAKRTFANILIAGQELLDEGGLEAVNSNAIVQRAGVSAPVFYHYFKNKHALLLVLADRLMADQDAVYQQSRAPAATEEELRTLSLAILQQTYQVTEAFAGARALLVSLRAVPELADVRIEANDRAARVFARQLRLIRPELSDQDRYERTRLAVEIGYSAIELLLENNSLSVQRVLVQTANAITAIYFA